MRKASNIQNESIKPWINVWEYIKKPKQYSASISIFQLFSSYQLYQSYNSLGINQHKKWLHSGD